MKEILFYAEYPTADNVREGMFQRISAVDERFRGCRRIYLSVSLSKNRRPFHWQNEAGDVEVWRLNFFLHGPTVRHIVAQYRNIYIHSVHGYAKLFPFSLRGKNVSLDFHGTVPEEVAFRGRRLLGRFFKYLERCLVPQVGNFIYVSDEMRRFYLESYPFIRDRKHLLNPIYPQNLLADEAASPQQPADPGVASPKAEALRRELGIGPDDVVFVYSGNLQKWQNVGLTIDCMNRIARDKYFFLFLSGQPEALQEMIRRRTTRDDLRYTVRKVAPEELSNYYEIAHYGFILRDDHLLNRVSAPTKLVEYLHHGLTAIVKYEVVGDAYSLGYEYLPYDADLSRLAPGKSAKNRQVARQLFERSCQVDLAALYE